MGCDILTNESCSNQLSILSELKSFREYLQLFNYDDIIHDLETKIINEKTFIYGDPAPEDEFKTLRGVQNFIEELNERVNTWINTISGENGEIDWDTIIDDGENPGKNHDIIKNSTSVIDALVKINNYLNNLTDTALFDVKVNGESVVEQDSNGLLFANIPVISEATASIGTNNSEEDESVDVNVTEQGNIRVVNFTFNNVKGRTGNTGATGATGPQGNSAVFDPNTGNILATLHNTIGSDGSNAMTQKAVTDELMYLDEQIDLSEYDEIKNTYINADNNWWRTDGTGNNNNCYLIPIEPGTKIKAIGNGNSSPQILFLTSNVRSNQAVLINNPTNLYAGGVQDYIRWSNSEEGEVKIAPYDTAYMYVRSKTSGSNVTPTVYIVNSVKEKVLEHNERIEEVLNSLSSVENIIMSRTLLYKNISYSGYEVRNWYIATASGLWANSANNPCCFLPVTPGMKLKLEASSNSAAHVAFLTSNNIEGSNKRPDYVEGTGLISIGKGKTLYTEVPDTATYMYIRLKFTNANINLTVGEAIELKDGFITEKLLMDSQVFNTTLINTGNWNVLIRYIDGNLWKQGQDGINTCKLIPCTPGQIIKLVRRSGLDYHAFFLKDNQNTVGETPHYAGGIETMPKWESEDKYVVVPDDGHYMYIRVRLDRTQVTPLPYDVTLIKDKIDDNGGEQFLIELVKYLGSGTNETLGLIHYSDIHGDSTAVKLLKTVLDKYSSYIDDSLVTGDVVHWYAEGTDDSNYPQGYDWWQDSGLAEKSLFVLGNHDGATKNSTVYDDKDGTAAWDGKGQQWCYDTYFANYIDGLGVTMPIGYDNPSNTSYYKACYWHKDYSALKIRLIGLDGNHRFDGTLDPNNNWTKLTNGIKHDDTAQEEWLVARLTEAKTLGYSVIVCGHYALDDYDNGNVGGVVINQRTNDVTNWHYRNTLSIETDPKYNYRNRVVSSNANRGWAKGSVNNIANIILAFVDGGGKFIAYLHGHYHCELMYYPRNYPNLLCIAAPQAGYTREGTTVSKPFSDMSKLSVNFICFDTEHNLIKMMRFGNKVNRFLLPMNCICYDYENKKVLNEW